MSEKIYARLLRLYPSRFREAYEEAALQLFRDRSRHERGFFATLHLWLDLIADLAVSVPRQRFRVHQAMINSPALRPTDATPCFHVLEGEAPRLGPLLLGGVLSLAAVGASISISHMPNYRPFQASPGDPGKKTTASTPQAAVAPVELEAVERHSVIRAIIANLKEHYMDAPAAQNMADALLAHENAGDYAAVTDGKAFAALLTKQLKEVSQDPHLDVLYSREPLPNRPSGPSLGPSPESVARYRAAMLQQNCTFEKVEMLHGDIGYLKLNSFPEPSVCGSKATAALASLNHAEAIIFDLRDNRGGYPEMVMLIAAYLFDHPEYMYNPRENTTERNWTVSPVPGNSLADRPVYVLTSARTFSAAEHFTYDLKMLKRATLVGETTGGGAHSGVFRRIDDHFGMGIPEVKPINPFSKTDWEGVGVEPDVKVKAADALITAEKLANRGRQGVGTGRR